MDITGKTPEETLKKRTIDLQDMIDFIEDMDKMIDSFVECDTITVTEALMALDSELELYNMEVAGG
jgi:hypothetical protein